MIYPPKVYKTISGDQLGSRKTRYTLYYRKDPNTTTNIERGNIGELAEEILNNNFDNIDNQVPEDITLINIPREADGSRITVERREPFNQDEISNLQVELQNRLGEVH